MVIQRKRSQFVVRELHSDAELARCADLDHAYSTDYVWQMDARQENDEVLVRFRTVRLPRTIQVPYPRDRASLLKAWVQRDCFLVAAGIDDTILGYVHMRIDTANLKGWIHDLVVSPPVRRHKIGSALMEQTVRWARLHQIRHLTLETQTKNYPAILFAQAHGFVFCGFNDHYYPNQDIALFFGRNL